MKKLFMAIASTAFMLMGSVFANTPSTNAAVLALDDSHSWATGMDTIVSVLGFKMVEVERNFISPDLNYIYSLGSPLGNLTFSPKVQKRTVYQTWDTWSRDYQQEVYFNGGFQYLDIQLPTGISAFDFYVQPNTQSVFDIEVRAYNGTTTSLIQTVDGNSGAKYYGFYTTDENPISLITIQAPIIAQGFAVAEFRLGTQLLGSDPGSVDIPEPDAAIALLSVGVLVASSLFHRYLQAKNRDQN